MSMTSRDEALRALEKHLRECARASDRAHMTGAAEDFRDAADRLQAILNESDRQEVAPDFWALERGCAALMGGDVWASFHPDHKAGLRKLLRDALSTGRAASGQEVAPVAWNDVAAWSLASIAEAAGAERDSDDNSTWWTLRIEHFNAMATSPAHTSEAGDAVWLDWLERNGSVWISEGYHNGVKRFFELRDSDDNKLSEGPSLRAAIGAAMRQEAGK